MHQVVIWVELTSLQRQYYRAVYEGQIGALLGGPGVKSLPGMRNLAMELRKLCCHPVRRNGGFSRRQGCAMLAGTIAA